MNSVLQCLSNTKSLLKFCLQDNLDSHLNTSSTSVMKGALMKGLSIDIHHFLLSKLSFVYYSLKNTQV